MSKLTVRHLAKSAKASISFNCPGQLSRDVLTQPMIYRIRAAAFDFRFSYSDVLCKVEFRFVNKPQRLLGLREVQDYREPQLGLDVNRLS